MATLHTNSPERRAILVSKKRPVVRGKNKQKGGRGEEWLGGKNT